MQPIAPQDRPKVAAATAGIIIAVGFLLWNLCRTTVRAAPRQPETAAGNAPAVPVAAAPGSPAAGSDQPSPALPGTEADAGANFGAVDLLRIQDPFRPLTGTVIAERPVAPAPTAAPPAASAPSAPPAATRQPHPVPGQAPARPILPHVVPAQPEVGAPAAPPVPRAAGALITPNHKQQAPLTRPGADAPATLPRQAEGSSTATPPAAPSLPMGLVGTVGSGEGAVAVFRVGEQTVFGQMMQEIAGWRVIAIGDGEVWLTHDRMRRRLHVGDALPDGSQPASTHNRS